jgi:hypothetical protein
MRMKYLRASERPDEVQPQAQRQQKSHEGGPLIGQHMHLEGRIRAEGTNGVVLSIRTVRHIARGTTKVT